MKLAKLTVIGMSVVGMTCSMPTWAEAGKAVFVSGDVSVKADDGSIRLLSKRDSVEAGDTVMTGHKGIVQLRMADKGFIAIRPNSEFRIDEFQLGERKEQDRGFFSLLKGGFRAVTGVIGKRERKSYQVRSTTATIGIRGTDYSARLCQQDCRQFGGQGDRTGGAADGLYVGVNTGGITLTNDLGTLDLDRLQYGYVKDSTSAPVALLTAPEFLFDRSPRPSQENEEESGGGNAQGTENTSETVAKRETVAPKAADVSDSSTIRRDLDVDQTELSQSEIDEKTSIEIVAETVGGSFSLLSEIESSRQIVSALSDGSFAIANVTENPYGIASVVNNNLTRFQGIAANGQSAVVTPGSSNVLDLGFDPVSGIAWGRWSGGSAQLVTSNNILTPSLQNNSLHWIAAPEQDGNFALPSSGTASYQLVGNTSPTDNFGHAGVLGSANLNANFNTMTVASDVAIGIDNRVWNGSASGMSLQSNGAFNGVMNTTVLDANERTFQGNGQASGFITNGAAGAGMGFVLQSQIDGSNHAVTGTAVFQKQ